MRGLALPVACLMVALALGGCLEELRGGGTVGPGDYLRDDDYREWLVEVDYVTGHRPSNGLLDLLKGRLSPLVHKPDGITMFVDDALPAEGRTWTTDDLRALRREHGNQATGSDRVVTHLIFVDGQSAADSNDGRVLGVAIGFDLVVIFSETIREVCSLSTLCTTTPQRILEAVTIHEFGHALGLVGREDGSGREPVPPQSDHEDPEHPGHSRNRGSVMYWAVESSNIVNLLRGGVPTTFDADDKADLCAAGGRC